MKKLYIISLLSILSLPAFGASATNPFDGITTVDAAWEKFESESQKILDSYKKQLNNKEFKKLKELRTDILKTKPKTQKDKTPEENKTVAERKLTPEEQEQKISELRDNADAMKEKEQSEANKMLGGSTMAATGMGGMQLASALAEQSADNEAEQDMRAYLATFSCKYGNEHASGGERDIELPGGNELINLYSEYVALANDLKVRKNALGVKPGIESEAILDSAKTGLYDDEELEPRTGAYASLARALQNPDGEDAKMWAAQREKTAENLKTGATAAGIGAVGGLVANLAINAKAPKERSAAINAKYASLKKELQKVQDEIDEVELPDCSTFGATGTPGNCKCPANQIMENESCRACANDEEVKENKCIKKSCQLSPTNLVTENCTCKGKSTQQSDNTCKCELTGAVNQSECVCNANTTQTDNNCECNDGFEQDTETGACIPEVKESKKIYKIKIPSDKFFEVNKATLTNEQKQQLLTKWQTALQTALETIEDEPTGKDTICVLFTGHADHTGEETYNQQLSEKRAKTVADSLNFTDTEGINIEKKTIGLGESQCPAEDFPAEKLQECRHVDITLVFGKCDEISQDIEITETLLNNGVIIGEIKQQ